MAGGQKQPNLLHKGRAALAYRNFTGALPKGAYTVKLDRGPQAAYRLGSLVGVAYEATRDGVTERYFHEFTKAARPDLAVRDDGRQLYVTRGRYRVTDRGIEDMSTLFVLNPSHRPSLRSKSSKRKPAMAASRRRSRNALGRFTKASFKKNPSRRGRTARRGRTTIMVRNPIKRRRRARALVAHRGRARRSFRRNPIGGMNIMALGSSALWIGTGAVGAEVVMGVLPIPANFKTGVARHLTKGAVGLAGGMLLARFGNRKAGEMFALGALTIAVHDAIKDSITKYAPGLNLGYYSPGARVDGFLPATRGHPGVAAYVPRMAGASSDGYNRMGQYVHMNGAASDGYTGRI